MGGFGRDPNEVAEWTMDQLFMVVARPKDLMPKGLRRVSYDEAVAMGAIKRPEENEQPPAPLEPFNPYTYDFD